MAGSINSVGTNMIFERCLFVGGPDHLSERTVEANTMRIEFMERPKHLPRYKAGEAGSVMMDCKVHLYRKVGKAAGLVIMEHVDDSSES
jgi:hypothetical protein